jgi:plasmid stabilization system protein ParE
MRQIRLRSKAKSDLFAIGSYTRQQWGEQKAEEIGMMLRRSFELIAETPYFGRKTRDEYVLVKVLPSVPFVIVYKVAKDVIFILRIVHTKRKR